MRAHSAIAAVAVDLLEAACGETRFQPTLIQLPDHADEGWAAIWRPTHDTALRTCILSLTALPDSARLAGLAIDSWTEVIPDTQVASGIAVHFDAPSARAPQAWLIATPPRRKAWTHVDVLALAASCWRIASEGEYAVTRLLRGDRTFKRSDWPRALVSRMSACL